MRYQPLSAPEFAALDGVDDWRFLLGGLHSEFRAGSFPAAAALVTAIADAAEAADHHPELSVRYPDRVRVGITTHVIGGISDADVALARTISELARDAGATAEPLTPQLLEIAIDTTDAERIRPFWAAVWAGEVRDGNVIDPLRHLPAIWFQDTDEPREQRNRIHLDITVAHDEADARVAAALAAGGTLVSDAFARSWWILADADGNEVCICTWQDRGR